MLHPVGNRSISRNRDDIERASEARHRQTLDALQILDVWSDE